MSTLFTLTPLQEAYADALGRTPKARKVGAERVGKMWGRYGKGPDGDCCRDCIHLHHKEPYLKCIKFGDSRGPGTDWRAKWPACGAFTARADAYGHL